MTNLCQQLQCEIGSLFECSPYNGFIRIRTPFLYPDGDVIDLFYTVTGTIGTISDCGETVRWLRSQSIASKRSIGQRRLIDDVCQTTGVEFFRGMIQSRTSLGGATLADAVFRVAQAAIRVADIWFTFRARSIQSVSDDVAELLVDRGIQYQQGVSLIGRSGRSRYMDFQTRTPRRSALVVVLSTGSRSAAHAMVDRTFASWSDLNHLSIGPEQLQFVSLFDDTIDVWGDEDFKMIEGMSRIARWSAPEEFVSILSAA